MLWEAFIYDPKTKTQKPLGRVRGKNQPAACLAAYKKFKIKDGRVQRYVGVRLVKPNAPPPLPPETVKELRALATAFNQAIKLKI